MLLQSRQNLNVVIAIEEFQQVRQKKNCEGDQRLGTCKVGIYKSANAAGICKDWEEKDKNGRSCGDIYDQVVTSLLSYLGGYKRFL